MGGEDGRPRGGERGQQQGAVGGRWAPPGAAPAHRPRSAASAIARDVSRVGSPCQVVAGKTRTPIDGDQRAGARRRWRARGCGARARRRSRPRRARHRPCGRSRRGPRTPARSRTPSPSPAARVATSAVRRCVRAWRSLGACHRSFSFIDGGRTIAVPSGACRGPGGLGGATLELRLALRRQGRRGRAGRRARRAWGRSRRRCGSTR